MADLIANSKKKKTSTSPKKPGLMDKTKKWFKEQEKQNIAKQREWEAHARYMRDREAEAKAQKEMKKFKKEISPKGVARAEASARKAIEEKYPGMFIPEKRTTAGVKKVGKKK